MRLILTIVQPMTVVIFLVSALACFILWGKAELPTDQTMLKQGVTNLFLAIFNAIIFYWK